VGQAREAVRADVEGQRLSAQAFLNEQLRTVDALQQQRLATIAAFRANGSPQLRTCVGNDKWCWMLFTMMK
jgi:hypothetical protein